MNRAKYSVEKMCSVLDVSRSAYYYWLKSEKRLPKSQRIEQAVAAAFQASKKTYGSPRISDELNEDGVQVSRSTVARVMNSLGLIARPRRKFVHTTNSKHNHRVFENILNRDFNAHRVNEKWVSDITYIPTRSGWAYLTIIMDLADRMIVGWSLSKEMTTKQTTLKALDIALQRRTLKAKLILHSDRGIQYCCGTFRSKINASRNIQQSMSRKGNCWDNAPAESFFKTLKVEWTYKNNYKNIEQARQSIFDYIERWYNTKRKHSTINYMSPLQKYYLLTRTVA